MLINNTVQVRLIKVITHPKSNECNYHHPLGDKTYTYYVNEKVRPQLQIGGVVLVTQPDNTLDAAVIIGNQHYDNAEKDFKQITKVTQQQLRGFIQFAYNDYYFAELAYHRYQEALSNFRHKEFLQLNNRMVN